MAEQDWYRPFWKDRWRGYFWLPGGLLIAGAVGGLSLIPSVSEFGLHPGCTVQGALYLRFIWVMAHGTILLVEDDGPVRGLFVRALKGAGYRVIEARNGVEALDVFQEHGATIDLIVTDMRLPYLGGEEVVEEVRRRRASLKVLCISAFPPLEGSQCDGFLTKPFTNAAFLTAVQQLLSNRP